MDRSRCLLRAGTHLLTELPLPDECQPSQLLPCPKSSLEPIASPQHLDREGTETWGQRRSCPLGEVKQGQCPGQGWQPGAHRPALPTCLAQGRLAKWPSQIGVLKWQRGRDGRTRRRADSVLPLLCPQGDSGGPLVCDNVAQGIVSYGQKDGSTPRAFTKVSSFLPWIKKTMKSL